MKPHLKSLLLGLGVLLLAPPLACTEELPQALDGGSDDHPAVHDLSPRTDGPRIEQDLKGSDAALPPLPQCDPSLNLTPLELAPTYCVVRRLTLAGLTESFNFRGLSAFTLEAPEAGTTWRVLQWPLDQSNQDPTPSTFYSFTSQLPEGATKLFPGRDLSISPGGLIVGGYTSDLIDGAIFWGGPGSLPNQVAAIGNYNVVFLDDDTLLVNGLGLGDAQEYQGVYVIKNGLAPRKLIDQLGTLSGHLALGKNALFAGGFLDNSNEVYGFALSKISAAISKGTTLTPGDGTLSYFGNLLDLAPVGDDLVVLEADLSQDFTALTRIIVTVSGDTVAPSNAEIIISNNARTLERVASDQSQIAMIWREGLNTEMAVIMVKD